MALVYLGRSCDHVPRRRLVRPPARKSLVRIEGARNHGQALVEHALVGRLEHPLLLEEVLEVCALHFLRASAYFLKERVEEVPALRVGTERGERPVRLHPEVLETGAELLHLLHARGDALLALPDEREDDRRDGGLGARRRDEGLGGARRWPVTLGRWPVSRRWCAVALWWSVRRRSGLPIARRAGRESIHGSKIRQVAVSRNRDLP